MIALTARRYDSMAWPARKDKPALMVVREKRSRRIGNFATRAESGAEFRPADPVRQTLMTF